MNQTARSHHRLLLRLAAVTLVAGVTPLACNVFVSLDRCQSDNECPTQYRCDLEFHFCVDGRLDQDKDVVVGESSTPDVDGVDASDGGGDVGDASNDTTLPPCNLSTPFETVTLVKGLEQLEIASARLVSDEMSIIFSATNGCSVETCTDLFIATRNDKAAPFVVSGLFPGVNTPAASEYWPSLTSDGLLLFFESSRSLTKVDGAYVGDRGRIWSATRANPIAQFNEPYIQDIFIVPPNIYEGSPYLHPNGKTLYFASTGRTDNKGRLDIFVAELGNLGAAKSVANFADINSEASELMPLVSVDERVLYFAREDEPDGGPGRRIMKSTRGSQGAGGGSDAGFQPPVPVTELNTANDWPSWLSDDQCRLFFVSTRADAATTDAGDAAPPSFRLWVAEHAQK